MAHITINQYLQQVLEAIDTRDGTFCAELLSFKHPHVANPRLQLANPEEKCQQVLEPPYDETVAAHLRALPMMYSVALDLRIFASNADQQLCKKGKGKVGDMLEKAAEQLMSCFRVCASDNRAGIDDSKKWGMLFLINQLFKIYFKGHMPTNQLLRKYDLLQFSDVTKAVSNSPHGSGDPKIQWASSSPLTKPASFFPQELESRCQRATDLWRTKASPAGVCSELTGHLTSRVRCRAVKRNSPCWFYLPNSRERLGQCDAPFGVPSKDRPTSHSQDANLPCTTHPALLPGHEKPDE
ncbi:UNVERIFIED_CONTAM: hypothetical protein FKN15_063449 [Acipenser sinensis]